MATDLRRWCLIAVLALALGAAACSGSATSSSADEAAPDGDPPAVVAAEDDRPVTMPLRIDSVEILGPDLLEVWVGVNGCRGVTVDLSETDDRVRLSAFQTLPSADIDCTDQGLIEIVEISLDAELGDREVVVERGDEPCLFTRPDFVCRPVVVARGGTERVVGSTLPPPRPVELAPIDGTYTLTLSDDAVVDFAPGFEHDQPYVIETRSLLPGIIGTGVEVTIHNVDREPEDEPVATTADGHPVHLISDTPPGTGPRTVVAIDTGTWWVDLEAWTADEDEGERLRALLVEQLTIVDRAGALPSVALPGPRLDPTWGVTLSAGGVESVSFWPAPNCEDERYPRQDCVPGLGHYEPFGPLGGFIAGTDPAAVADRDGIWEPWPSDPPEGVSAAVRSWGSSIEEPTCVGSAAFDPALLPNGIVRGLASEQVGVYTGLDRWRAIAVPGRVVEYAGPWNAPTAVAVYERTAPGAWAVLEVTACGQPS